MGLSIGPIEGVAITPLAQIPVAGGGVLHALKVTDPQFAGFGEAYFSFVHQGCRKGWKRHRQMVLNLLVPVGAVRFVLFDDRAGAPGRYQTAELSADMPAAYARLTVPPGLWMAFAGIGPGNQSRSEPRQHSARSGRGGFASAW